jgi:hypothetical protein
MSLAKNLILVVLASSLAACGGMEQEESSTNEPVSPPTEETQAGAPEEEGSVSAFSGTCTGYDGNNYCLVECYDGTNYWYNVGHVSTIRYGDCTEAGRAFCAYYGWSRQGSCWGYGY